MGELKGMRTPDFSMEFLTVKGDKIAIRGLLIDGVWVENLVQVKEGVHDYFQSLFQESTSCRPTTNCALFSTLTLQVDFFLQSPFTYEEIKRAVWNCGSTKAPGPDGFIFGFLKRY